MYSSTVNSICAIRTNINTYIKYPHTAITKLRHSNDVLFYGFSSHLYHSVFFSLKQGNNSPGSTFSFFFAISRQSVSMRRYINLFYMLRIVSWPIIFITRKNIVIQTDMFLLVIIIEPKSSNFSHVIIKCTDKTKQLERNRNYRSYMQKLLTY